MAHVIHSICLLCQQHQSKRLHTYFLPSELFLIGIYLFRQGVICTFFISDELEIITHFNQFYSHIFSTMGNSDIDTQSTAENHNIIQAMATGWHQIRNFTRKENYIYL